MKVTIKNLIQNYSFNQVDQQFAQGQISQTHYEAYCRVWEWCAPRFGGSAGFKQESYWKRHGKEAYFAKINRVRKAFGFELYSI